MNFLTAYRYYHIEPVINRRAEVRHSQTTIKDAWQSSTMMRFILQLLICLSYYLVTRQKPLLTNSELKHVQCSRALELRTTYNNE